MAFCTFDSDVDPDVIEVNSVDGRRDVEVKTVDDRPRVVV